MRSKLNRKHFQCNPFAVIYVCLSKFLLNTSAVWLIRFYVQSTSIISRVYCLHYKPWPGFWQCKHTLAWPRPDLGQEILAHINLWPGPGLGQPYVSVNTFGQALGLIAMVTWAVVASTSYNSPSPSLLDFPEIRFLGLTDPLLTNVFQTSFTISP